jgi:hypothetical protein
MYFPQSVFKFKQMIQTHTHLKRIMAEIVSIGVHILDVPGRHVSEIPPGQEIVFIDEIRITEAGTSTGTSVDMAKLGCRVTNIGAVGNEDKGMGEMERGARFFFQPNKTPFLWRSMVFLFFRVECKLRNLLVSVLLLIHVSSTWKFTAKFLLGNQVQNLAAKFELAKFEFGTWHELGTNLAVIKYNASGESSHANFCSIVGSLLRPDKNLLCYNLQSKKVTRPHFPQAQLRWVPY